jgi:hypothetical protein
MKKSVNFRKKLMLAVLFAAAVTFPLQANAEYWTGEMYGAGEQASDDGQNAVNSNSNEGASTNAGYNFDTASESPPVVDLSGAGDHPTVQLLRNPDNSNPYTPQQYRSLHTTPPPMP